jgi:competence protein ComEC
MKHVAVHLLNVGHGDCTFIRHASGRITMIDINNSKSLPVDDEIALAEDKGLTLSTFRGVGITTARGERSWESYYQSLLVDPFDYYKAHFDGETIFRYIQTHPDMDHLSGLFRFFWQEGVPVVNVWDTNHKKNFTESDFDNSPHDWKDWLTYQVMRNGELKDGNAHKVLQNLRGESGSYWNEDGLTVWGPNADLVDYCNNIERWNNVSYVLRLEYGGRVLVLPGDAEKPAWDAIEAHVGIVTMQCDLLKAAHHGRESGYSESAVEAMRPDLVFCSVGKKPATDASDEYASYGAKVLSTRYNGTIVVRIWEDGEVEVFDHKGDRIGGLPILRS